MSSLDYLDLCRLCLVKDRVGISIFEDEGDARQVFLKIASCLPVKVSREDKLPKKICDDCMYKLELFYQFWNTTANAEKQLLQWLDDVDMQDKQGYVTEVLNPSLMKQEQQASENRLDENVLQVGTHQNNMGMGMMDNMGLGMPIIISTTNQPMTSVSMDTSGSSVQTIQAVPGTSTQSTHDQISQNQVTNVHHNVDEDSDDDEENESDDECDADDGLPVKEENEDDPNNRTVEPTTFVNVSLPCDEAGPSGLQQQKITEMPEMAMPQIANADNKTGRCKLGKSVFIKNSAGKFILQTNPVPMRLYQYVDSNGVTKYSLLPALDIKNSNQTKSTSIVKIEENLEEEEQEIEMEEVEEEVVEEEEEEEEEINYISNENFYICEKCNKTFSSETLFQQHQLTHNKWKMEIRHFHGDGNSKLSHLESKQIVGQKKLKILSCDICNFTCIKQKSLEAHAWKHASNEIDTNWEQLSDTIEENSYLNNDKSKKKHNLREQKKQKTKLSCSQCNFQCVKKLIMLNHVTKEHQQETINNYRCNFCDFTCSTRNILHIHKSHHRVINDSNIFICNYCGFRAKKKTFIHTHIKKKHLKISLTEKDDINTPKFYFCQQCDYKNKSKYELKIHVIRKHTDDYKFPCETCGKKFKVRGDLTNHVRFSHKEQPVICDVCGKTCMNSNSLYVHQKFAHYKAKYECHLCKRRMVSQENLNEHMVRQHEQRENAVCEECGKTFSRHSRLKIHMRIHTGDKPYSCTICTKSFARRTALKQHLLIHTGIRPYVCDICGKSFTQKPGLISHRKSHPGSHPPLPRVLIDHILSDVMNR
ncbi:zinc finger protein 112-like isoform X5 [Leptopilina boulardi]|uniref:zinc finger protein 112-like isoform X5 n=1 Tax=Leptopilina boulardi TaxID=63433 RepID=UPI0021F5C273|nr:zinc finger protein 112-like isoform X5 [Leptopilina boulardi]